MKNSNLWSYVFVVLGLLVILVASLIARSTILGGDKVIKLGSAAPLYGQISQTLIKATGGNPVLSANNYNLSNPKYFDNATWVVASFTPKNGQGDKGYVLMNKIGSFYQVVLGPGTLFPNNLLGIPNDVYLYLQNQGIIGSFK